MKNKNGFTSVDVLISLIILGILMAIVVPQFTEVETTESLEQIKTQVEAPRELSEARKFEIQQRKENRELFKQMDEVLQLYLEHKGKVSAEVQKDLDAILQAAIDRTQERIDTQENSLFTIKVQMKIDIMQVHLDY